MSALKTAKQTAAIILAATAVTACQTPQPSDPQSTAPEPPQQTVLNAHDYAVIEIALATKPSGKLIRETRLWEEARSLSEVLPAIEETVDALQTLLDMRRRFITQFPHSPYTPKYTEGNKTLEASLEDAKRRLSATKKAMEAKTTEEREKALETYLNQK